MHLRLLFICLLAAPLLLTAAAPAAAAVPAPDMHILNASIPVQEMDTTAVPIDILANSTTSLSNSTSSSTATNTTNSTVSHHTFHQDPNAALIVAEIFGPHRNQSLQAIGGSFEDPPADSAPVPTPTGNATGVGSGTATSYLPPSWYDCIDVDTRSPTITGRCNNLFGNSQYGTVGSNFLRLMAPVFGGDGSGSTMIQSPLNPRLMSNIIFSQDEREVGGVFDERGLSNWIVDFGQFLNHDRNLNSGSGGFYHDVESIPIQLPLGEHNFSQAIPFQRAEYADGSGTSRRNPRKFAQMASTGWLDASPVYGSSEMISKLLRGERGTLKSQILNEGEFPWFQKDLNMPDASAPSSPEFLLGLGDSRGNEQLGLTVMHVLWFREHNRQAREIASTSPYLSSDEIFTRARRMVIALLQKCSMEYFAALGVEITEYSGYTGRDPSAYIEYVAAALRAGHSQIYDQLERMDAEHKECCGNNVPLIDGFSAPQYLWDSPESYDAFLRGFSYSRAQAVDVYCVDSVRQLLFGPGSGLDLIAIDIARQFDVGLPSFGRVRSALGLPPITTLKELTSDRRVRQRLRRAFATIGVTDDASILSKLDLLTGSLAERHVKGTSLGATFLRIFSLTLDQTRTSDRFWFERIGSLSSDAKLDASLRAIVFNTKFSDIVARNSNIPREELQENIFFAKGPFQGNDSHGTATNGTTTNGNATSACPATAPAAP